MKQVISNETLKALCSNNDWFTEGTNNQYEKMLYANSNGCSIEELVSIIWLCSDINLHGFMDIKAAIESECDVEAFSRDEQIVEFIKRKVPVDWNVRSIEERKKYWIKTALAGEEQSVELVVREKISAVEIWCELFNGDKRCMSNSNVKKINAIIAKQNDWSNTAIPMRFGPYGVQRGFIKKT